MLTLSVLFQHIWPHHFSSSSASALLRRIALHGRFGLFIQTSGSLGQPFVASGRKERAKEKEGVGDRQKTNGCHSYAEGGGR